MLIVTLIIKVVAIDNVGEPSPVMATFLKIATETVYKMAGLGAFEASVAYKVNYMYIISLF